MNPRSRGAGAGRRTLSDAILVIAAGLSVAAGCGSPPPEHPNLVLITVDTLRADRLGCYGGDPGVGVAICDIGERGFRFRWAISTAPSTAPSVASILTSRYPSGHGVKEIAATVLADEVLSVAEVLRDAGYHTAAFVSNPVLRRGRRLDQGFEIYDDHMDRRERNRPHHVERTAEDATDGALAWVGVVDEPWFLWIHYQDPHGPYDPPSAAPARDEPGARRLPVLADHSGHGGIPAYQVLPQLRSQAAYERRYVEEILYLDRHLARLVDGFSALGTSPGILLTADHGEAFGDDGYYFAHGHSVGLDQIRVPLLWRPPQRNGAAVTAAAEIADPVSTIDVAPTLLRAAAIDLPESFRGRPLPESNAPHDPKPRPLFAEQRWRTAVVLGSTYYARDRAGFEGPKPNPISGGELEPMAPRGARLGAGPALPGYRTQIENEAELEAILEGFVAASDAAQPSVADVPESMREELRALGYLE